MKIYTKDVAPLGFNGSGVFIDSAWYHFYYKEIPSKRRFYIIDALDLSLSHFTLNLKQYGDYKNSKLSLVPGGCCNASGGKCLENPVIDVRNLESKFGTKKKMLEYIKGVTRDA